MTTLSCFSRQNDPGLRVFTVVLRENLALVVVLIQESKALYCRKDGAYYCYCVYVLRISRYSISGPKRSVKITDRFTCTSANVIYCITCTLCNKLYIGETGRRLGDRFREHLRDVEKNDKDASKPVARHFNLPNHSIKHMAICGLSLHLGTTESRKNLEQKFIFQIGTLNPHGINERFSFN